VAWRPLHVREYGLDDGPYEGVPSHLAPELWRWVTDCLFPHNRIMAPKIRTAALMVRIPLSVSDSSMRLYDEMRDACLNSEDVFLQYLSLMRFLLCVARMTITGLSA